MADFSKLSRLMRSDWDRRVNHDYRFWMSDGLASDEEMWRAGERDFEIVARGIQSPQSKVILELGCGVGRLVRPALKTFEKVIGIDVSESAIKKAASLIGSNPKLELIVGNGFDLTQIADQSVDVVFSFAALICMPTDVIANYLLEINRILKPSGIARLQVYCGSEYRVCRDDTLHVRCFSEPNLRAAFDGAGFALSSMDALELPLKISFDEIGIRALMVSLEKTGCPIKTIGEVSQALLPGGEVEVIVDQSPNDLEHWTALNYADQLVRQGQIDKAKETIEYAVKHSQNLTIDTKDMLQRIVDQIEQHDSKPEQTQAAEPGYFIANLDLLRDKFPAVYQQVRSWEVDNSSLEVRQSQEGPALWYCGQCLDHASKPIGAGEVWAKRELNERQSRAYTSLVIGGFASGYHVESILAQTSAKVAVIEPHIAVLWQAMQSRDLRNCFTHLSNLVVGEECALDFLDENTELTIRPQHQAINPEFWSKVKSNFYGARGLLALSPKIAVLGPIQGGTLPMVPYCMRALFDIKQRPRDLDMSGFASGFHLAEKFVTGRDRQQSLQSTYIELMSQFILEALTEKPVDILICMAQAPASGRVLTELRKRGVITVLWFVEDYMRFTYWKNIAQYYDFVFTIQKGKCIELIRQAGADEVHYLPTACDPFVHRPVVMSQDDKAKWGSPISFVGAGYHNRQQVFASMAELPIKLWGTEWPTCKPFDRMVQEQGRRLTPEEYVKIFCSSDINVNLHSSAERDGVDPFGDFLNPRTFELAACEAFQLVDERSLLAENFDAGKELITFSSPKDLKEKISYYMARPEERRQIAAAGRARVLRDHTYSQRIKQMLSVIYSSRFESLKRRSESSPWHKMLERSKIDPELQQRCEAAYRRGEEPILDGLVADIVSGKGKLSETEQKLLFLFHVRKQIIRMRSEEMGVKAG